jgi:hypothetical protein
VTDANSGSARRQRAVFGRWPKTREREKRHFQEKLREHAFGYLRIH